MEGIGDACLRSSPEPKWSHEFMNKHRRLFVNPGCRHPNLATGKNLRRLIHPFGILADIQINPSFNHRFR